MQKAFESHFDGFAEPNDAVLNNVLSDDPSEFVRNASSYYISPLNNEEVILKLVGSAKLLFELHSGSIVMTFRRFILLDPFLMNWFGKRTSFTKAPGNSSFTGHYICKMHSAKFSSCRCKLTLRMNFDAQTVVFSVDVSHNHDYSSMITNFPGSYLKSPIEAISVACEDTSPTAIHDAARNSLCATVCKAFHFDCIPKRYFRNVSSHDSKLRMRKSSYRGPDNWDQDISEIPDRLQIGGLHSMTFRVAGLSAVLIAADTFFREMVEEKRVVMMSATCGVCTYSEARLISMAYRDRQGNTRIGATALARPSSEPLEDIAAFIEAIFVLAKEQYGLQSVKLSAIYRTSSLMVMRAKRKP